MNQFEITKVLTRMMNLTKTASLVAKSLSPLVNSEKTPH